MTATIANQYVVLYIITFSCSLIVLQKIQTHTDTHAHVSLFWQFRKSHHVQYLHANYNVYIINIKQWSVDNKKTNTDKKTSVRREGRWTSLIDGLDFSQFEFRLFFLVKWKKVFVAGFFFFIFFLLNYNYRDEKNFSRKKRAVLLVHLLLVTFYIRYHNIPTETTIIYDFSVIMFEIEWNNVCMCVCVCSMCLGERHVYRVRGKWRGNYTKMIRW